MSDVPSDSDDGEHRSVESPDSRTVNSVEARDVPFSFDILFDTLSDARRRFVLYYLAEHDGRVTVEELAEQFTGLEDDGTAEPGPELHRRTRTGLYHIVLPKLDDHGFVEFDREPGLVGPTENVDRIASCLALVREIEDATRETRANPERTAPDANPWCWRGEGDE